MSLLIESLTVSYGHKKIIHNMSLPAIAPGSLVAVLGANAVGKSTLLKSLAGLLKYTGQASLYKQALTSFTQEQRMKMIGYLPQSLPQVSTLVAYELIYSACRATSYLDRKTIERRIENIFERLDIQHLALKKMREMSGGQRQMIGLAQVLIGEPHLLLLDEPTSALDLHWQLNVLQAIRDETENKESIAFVASHDLNLALRFCDQVLILAPEGVLAIGKPEQVLTPDNLQTAYGIEARIESCSQGYPVVLADRAANKTNIKSRDMVISNYSNVKKFVKAAGK